MSDTLLLLLSSIRKNQYRLFFIVMTIAMLGLQLLDVPTLSDDMLYRFVWQQDESAPARLIKNIGDLITSQWAHYQIVNGRWVVHGLAQAFLSFFPPVIYQSCNAVLFSLMLWLASKLMVGKEHRLFCMAVMCFLLFVVFADIKTTMLWSMGTFNYLWVTVWTLAFLLYLRRIHHSKSPIHWLLSPFALLIGCGHEALSLPLSITLVVYAVFELRRKEFYPIGLYIVWYVIGTILCLLSPGILGRADGDITLLNRMISGAINVVLNLKVTWLLVITNVSSTKKVIK